MSESEQGGSGVRELRLALVLYGGVSLAIYMHGTTRELHRLVRASALADGEEPPTPSERVYRELLAARAQERGVRTRVVCDVIAGTSAGGINGVYLAKALAHDRPQDALRDLWFERGDLGGLVRGPRRIPLPLRLSWVLPTLWRRPLLDGDRMGGWLYEALEAMDAGGGDGSLMPPGHELELFVTMTDFHGYRRQVPTQDPAVVTEARHRHVMRYRYGRDRDDFTASTLDNAALAFGARATSCFPGVFPPVSLSSFESCLSRTAGVDVDLGGLRGRFFPHYGLAGAPAEDAWFVDGGVLDNRPFGHVIDAVRRRPAQTEVDRRVLYVDPDPAPEEPDQDGPARGAPNPVATVLASLVGLPRNEPLLDELLRVEAHNDRVRQVRSVIETQWDRVTDLVDATLEGQDLAALPPSPDDARLGRWRSAVHERAVEDAGLAYATYVRTKVGDVVGTWARTVCRLCGYPPEVPQAAVIRSILWAWADRAGLFQREQVRPSDDQVAFLRDLDLGYGIRRLRFVIAALSWWYEPTREEFPLPTRAQLDAGKARLARAVAELEAAEAGRGLSDELCARITACLGAERLEGLVRGRASPGAFLDHHTEELNGLVTAVREHLRERLVAFTPDVYRDMHALTADWHPEARRRLLVRYLGFPIWDALLFPLQALTDAGERDHVEIVRVSPREATLLGRPDPAKLEGVRMHHFGAFLSRRGRENDYLWGRLDAAERLVTLLLGRADPAWCRRAFEAILAEESSALDHARGTLREVRRRLEDRPRGRESGPAAYGGTTPP